LCERPSGGDDLARLRAKLLEGEERVVVDAARREYVGDRVADPRWGDRHRRVLAAEEVDLDVAPDPVGFANSGGLVFVDEAAEEIAAA